MSEAMITMVEGNHVGLLRHIMGKKSWRTTDRMWATLADREVLRAAGVHTTSTYIGRIKEVLSNWVALILIFKVWAWVNMFEVGGRQRIP